MLDYVRLRPGMTLADIGTGDGLVGFRAIERAGASIRVLMTDISAPLLRHTEDPFSPLLLRCRAAQFPDTEKARSLPITNYGERDLVRFAIDAGFTDIHLELHIEVRTEDSLPWETFLRTSPHPLAPSLEEVFEKESTRDERAYLEVRMRAIFESGAQLGAERIAYLTAKRP
ncbi:class I SAM-dependent methyltransferase [Paraburkholderia sp. CNPSo 3281]|uniref:class I SAM-dependent methyltransferase n=1 Tax=Paraburkholderia sp. CNPSo 3281 TaxID=2940933 RepID=UPI0020B79DCA|nr:class I SAM-dependent methyltransferase [Paraburkholderia sp. CNPSo 3281]MCP3714590.1 class I SAM-dependent methyltransferase [Paraburkholderia sp. CNPSo 3281]